ncbi:hypothetical protein EG329_000188 [Mollisiaceae sp. DMI_Dod_QoI]|nr:hypothetical protein EG329_000188 [Helotiales sp. DMI_Dod_QoI]
MGGFNYNANIMLDLECTAVEAHNPALIELGAVYFDPVTGAELGSLKTPINLQSCWDHGLVSDDNTTAWVERNIPETLATSKLTSVTLENALFKFSSFVRNSVIAMKKTLREAGRNPDRCEPMIWGNGAVADNVWINSAYLACGMQKPWKFYNDMCVRSAVKYAAFITGRDCSFEVKRKGKHHDALDDCRHQVAYLVLATKSLMPKAIPTDAAKGSNTGSIVRTKTLSRPRTSQREPGLPDKRPYLESPLEEVDKKDFSSKASISDESVPTNKPQAPTRPALPTPNTSFSGAETRSGEILEVEQLHRTGSKRRRGVPSKGGAVLRPGMLPTPDTSFSSTNGDIEDIPTLASQLSIPETEGFLASISAVMHAKAPLKNEEDRHVDLPQRCLTPPVSAARKEISPLSPGTLFCFLNEELAEDEYDDPPFPTPATRRNKNIQLFDEEFEIAGPSYWEMVGNGK